jgi:hypothetical protein
MRRAFEKWGRPPYPKEFSVYLEETRRLCPSTITMEKYLRGEGYASKILA